eukprot:CAMPEP_0113942860 /NCGR_PEP_ID=MMETSP1339-20121228/13172_1 /TAXON_ID=94617 /ORGANISM="Fibrocapsa japonica" /LENGTH=104 /DNA_ID=CAMNT_0000947521 /DNA_START=206 /DNA_END=520 /DNA_ORIENTATION=- /assembly_acc=CAM_ASM_000762
MGLFDALKKGFENDSSLSKQSANPGLSKAPEPVNVCFNGEKTMQAIPGTSLKEVCRTARVKVVYDCNVGDCKTCTITCNGRKVKACQETLPKSKGTINIVTPVY